MTLLQKYFGTSPFGALTEHTKKVHDCVELLKALCETLMEGDHEKVVELHHEMSRTEHEADVIKTEIRDQISKVFLLSIGRSELLKFLSAQDDVADCAEDFAVVARLRKTPFPDALKPDFRAFVDQVVLVSEKLLSSAEELAILAETSFEGEATQRVLQSVDDISVEEWEADKLERKFAEHAYSMEAQLDPITLMFYDKYCRVLGSVANAAEKCAKMLRALIVGQ